MFHIAPQKDRRYPVMKFEVKDGGFGYPREECIFSHVDFIMDKPEVMSVLGANPS